jgi:hypothetical protein
METMAQGRLAESLGRETRFRWTGAPARGIIFRPTDAYAIPFSLLWGGFAIFWESTVLLQHAPIFFKLWGIPFVLLGLYMIVGRFFVDRYLRAHTAYAVGDTAPYILRDGLWPRTITVTANALSPLELRRRTDGSGTIVFGPRTSNRQSWNWETFNGAPGSAFERIDRVDEVYALLSKLAANAAGGAG